MRYVPEEAIRRLVKRNGHCCDSCHDDAEQYEAENMYQLRELELGKDRWAEVCCSVGIAYDDWIKRRRAKEGK